MSRHRTEESSQPFPQTVEDAFSVAEMAGAQHSLTLQHAHHAVRSMADTVTASTGASAAVASAVISTIRANADLSCVAAAATTRAAVAQAKLLSASSNATPASCVVVDNSAAVMEVLSNVLQDKNAGEEEKSAARRAITEAARITRDGVSKTIQITTDLHHRCVELRRRAAQAEGKCCALEAAARHHDAETLALVRAVDTLSVQCEDAEALRNDNLRMKAHLRSIEAVLTPAQICAAALPPNYRPPASFSALAGPIPAVLRTAAPALFALRLMDRRELTLTEVTADWLAMSEHVDELRQELRKAATEQNDDRRRIAELEVSVVDEKVRRQALEKQINLLTATKLDNTMMRHEIAQARLQLSLALDEKVAALSAQERLTLERDQALIKLQETSAALAEAQNSLKNRWRIADELAALKLTYTRSQVSLLAALEQSVTQQKLTQMAKDALEEQLKATERLAATTAEGLHAATVKAASAEAHAVALKTERLNMMTKIAEQEKTLAHMSRDATKRIVDVSVSGASTKRPSAVGDLDRLTNAVLNLTSDVGRVSSHLSNVAQSVVDDSTTLTGGAALRSALQAAAASVHTVLTNAERIRTEVAENFVDRDRRIEALRGELGSALAECQATRERLAAIEAWGERAALQVTETVLGHSIAVAETTCASCDRRIHEAEYHRARATEAGAVAEVLSVRIRELETEVHSLHAHLRQERTENTAIRRSQNWFAAQLREAHEAALSTRSVEVELARSEAVSAPESDLADPDDDTRLALEPAIANDLNAVIQLLSQAALKLACVHHSNITDAAPTFDTPQESTNADLSRCETAVQVTRRNLVEVVAELWRVAIQVQGQRQEDPLVVQSTTSTDAAAVEATAKVQELETRLQQSDLRIDEATKVIDTQKNLVQFYIKKSQELQTQLDAQQASTNSTSQRALDEERAKVAGLETTVARLTKLVDLYKQRLAAGPAKPPAA